MTVAQRSQEHYFLRGDLVLQVTVDHIVVSQRRSILVFMLVRPGHI